jgi:hypothetical protein
MTKPDTVSTADGTILIANLTVADSLLARMRGLLGRAHLESGRGLLITRCNAIHTVGMQFPIDAAFLNRTCRITRIYRNVGPMRIVRGGRGASMVLEVQTGWLDWGRVREGETLVLSIGDTGAGAKL